MSECSVKGCKNKAEMFLETLRFCKKHAKESGFKGWKKSPVKRKEGYKNIIQFDEKGYPSCEKHGALNCVNKACSLWRCIPCGVGVSFKSVEAFNKWLTLHRLEKEEGEKK